MTLNKPRDLDAQMMAGCSVFVGVSLLSFLMSLWPFFAWPSLWEWRTLGTCVLVAIVPVTLIGMAASRRWSVAGATGYIAGAMSFAVFLVLRLDQIRLSAVARQTPDLQYPPSMVVLLPIAWILTALFIAIAFYRQD